MCQISDNIVKLALYNWGKCTNDRTQPTDRTTTTQNQLWELPKELRIRWAPIGQMWHRIRIRTVCGEGLTKLLRSTRVCLDSICDGFHKSKYLIFLFFCRRIPTSKLTILQNLKQFKLVNLYLQGFEDWSFGHWRTYLICLTKFSQVFGIWHSKTCTKIKCTSIDTHNLKFGHVVWLVKKKTIRQLTSWNFEMTHTTRHVTLNWHFKRKCRCWLTFIFVFKNITWHFRFEVGRQVKFVKHTDWMVSGFTSRP
jgi:hypothetical protein